MSQKNDRAGNAADEEKLSPKSHIYKIVVHLQGGEIVKGHLRHMGFDSLAALLEGSGRSFPQSICVEDIMDGSPIEVEWGDLKAAFLVKSFEGDGTHETIRFYANGPEVGSIWAEIEFKDGEILEGCIYNSMHHLVEDGFFVHPSDPHSNSILAYVNKSAIVNYRVLGLRMVEDR